jgi:PEP-CTERM motif
MFSLRSILTSGCAAAIVAYSAPAMASVIYAHTGADLAIGGDFQTGRLTLAILDYPLKLKFSFETAAALAPNLSNVDVRSSVINWSAWLSEATRIGNTVPGSALGFAFNVSTDAVGDIFAWELAFSGPTIGTTGYDLTEFPYSYFMPGQNENEQVQFHLSNGYNKAIVTSYLPVYKDVIKGTLVAGSGGSGSTGTSVPEPANVSLMGLGLIGILTSARKRRRQAK